jgi:hypothetical protein
MHAWLFLRDAGWLALQKILMIAKKHITKN